MKKTFPISRLYFLGFITFLSSCVQSPNIEQRFKDAAINYANIVLANYEDCIIETEMLKSLIDSFIQSPSEDKFEACKSQWIKARAPYGKTEAYRFYGGPIDGENGPEGLINAWPMDENFIDYTQGSDQSGIINNTTKYPNITKELLVSLNESISESSISTGYHAIEFLLWGQDFYSDSPGQRKYTDYVQGGTAQNPERRGQYLSIITSLLIEHLQSVKKEWETEGSYRSTFLALSKKDFLTKVFTGLNSLCKGELADERMLVAVDSKDQENEHSCFSDNTHNDFKDNIQSLINVYTGTYKRIDGSTITGESLYAIASTIDPEKANAVNDLMNSSKLKIEAIPVPFDQAIINSEDIIKAAINELYNTEKSLTQVRGILEES